MRVSGQDKGCAVFLSMLLSGTYYIENAMWSTVGFSYFHMRQGLLGCRFDRGRSFCVCACVFAQYSIGTEQHVRVDSQWKWNAVALSFDGCVQNCVRKGWLLLYAKTSALEHIFKTMGLMYECKRKLECDQSRYVYFNNALVCGCGSMRDSLNIDWKMGRIGIVNQSYTCIVHTTAKSNQRNGINFEDR